MSLEITFPVRIIVTKKNKYIFLLNFAEFCFLKFPFISIEKIFLSFFKKNYNNKKTFPIYFVTINFQYRNRNFRSVRTFWAFQIWTFFLSIFKKFKYFSKIEFFSFLFMCRELFFDNFSEIQEIPFIM